MPVTVASLRSTLWLLLAILSVSSAQAWAQAYDGARREEVDGGVHTPVLTKAPELAHFVEAVYPPEAAETKPVVPTPHWDMRQPG